MLGAAKTATPRQGNIATPSTAATISHSFIRAATRRAPPCLPGDEADAGGGENLNEHIAGKGWPSVGKRHEMLSEAVDVISGPFDGEASFNFRGRYFGVESAKLWDLPEERVPIAVAVSEPDSCRLAGDKADAMVAVEPKSELGQMFDEPAARASRVSGRSRSPTTRARRRDRARARPVSLVRFRLEGERRFPNPDSFESATQFVTPGDVAEQLACGPDVDERVEKIKAFIDAGFIEIALVQIGADQQEQFAAWGARELLPALRSL